MRVKSFVLALSIGGCALAADDEPQAIPKIVRNTVAFDDIVANQAAMTTLAANKFSLNNAAAASMLGTEQSREVLNYLIGCALPASKTFSVSAGGTTHVFQGDAGLAKSWTATALTIKQKRWISACMLARVNNQHQLMKISLRGPHHALHVTSAETDRFTLEEGVYYGDIFTGVNPIVGWSCRGAAQAAGEGEEGSALDSRDCAEPGFDAIPELPGDVTSPTLPTGGGNQCGWGFSGDCFVHEFGLPFACEEKVTTSGEGGLDGDASDHQHGSNAPNTYYKRCHAGGEIPLLQPLWKEVITVYVEDGPPSLD